MVVDTDDGHDRSDPACGQYDDSDTDEHMGHCVICCDGWCLYP